MLSPAPPEVPVQTITPITPTLMSQLDIGLSGIFTQQGGHPGNVGSTDGTQISIQYNVDALNAFSGFAGRLSAPILKTPAMTHIELQMGPTGTFPDQFKVELKDGPSTVRWFDYTSVFVGPNERILLNISGIPDGTPFDRIIITFDEPLLLPSRTQGNFTITGLQLIQASSLGAEEDREPLPNADDDMMYNRTIGADPHQIPIKTLNLGAHEQRIETIMKAA